MSRVATAAHPLCVCGKWKRAYSTHDWIYRDVDPVTGMPGSMAWGWVEKTENYRSDECPMHGPSLLAEHIRAENGDESLYADGVA